MQLFVTSLGGRSVVLFEQTVTGVVNEHAMDPDDFFSALRKVANPVRQNILNQNNNFKGHLEGSSQADAVPKRLLLVVKALMNGNYSTPNKFDQETLTCSQIIVSNCRKASKTQTTGKVIKRRHNVNRETPVMLYVSLKIYSLSRSRDLITHLFNLGLCVSYTIEFWIYASGCMRISESPFNCFFPNILKIGLFSITCKDNVDVLMGPQILSSLIIMEQASLYSSLQHGTIRGKNFQKSIFQRQLHISLLGCLLFPRTMSILIETYCHRSQFQVLSGLRCAQLISRI